MSSVTKLFLLELFVCVQLVSTGKVPAIVVFGDSTMDSGNNNAISTFLKSNFRPYGRDFYGGKPTGRFCNGRIVSDFFSEALGLKPIVPAYLDPAYGIEDFATGVTFASAGSGFDNVTADMLSVIPLWKQVEYFAEYKGRLEAYMGNHKAMITLNDTIYIISIGTNDFLENYFINPHRFMHFSVLEYEDFLIGLAEEFIVSIYRLGARKISMTGLSVIGCLPVVRLIRNLGIGDGCLDEFNEVSKSFNVKMSALIDKLNERLPGLRMVLSPVYDILNSIIQNPSLYGFENVKVGCCGTGRLEFSYLCNRWSPLTCEDADKYAFWDSIHPSEKSNRILAHHTLNTTLAQFL